MSDEGAGLGKGFATERTDTGLLSCNTYMIVLGCSVGNIDNTGFTLTESVEYLCGYVHAAAELQGH